MAGPYLFDRVRETTTTTGTGTITLAGAVAGYRTFGSVLTTADTCFYCITSGSAWEVGVGSYSSISATLSRDTILQSSNSNNAINLSGTSDVFITAPAAVLMARNALSVTAAATLTVASHLSYSLAALKWIVCSGTTSDYTVTLPAASTCAGSYIALRMAAGLTKLVTIDGNSSETIDGATTRIMWASETAVLYCDGTGWYKVAGRTIPMVGKIALNADQNVATSTLTAITYNSSVIDNTGMMVNTGSNRLDIKRPGFYLVSIGTRFDTLSAATTRAYTLIVKSGVGMDSAEMYGPAGGVPHVLRSEQYSLVAGDTLTGQAFHATGATEQVLANETSLMAVEAGPW